jgi:predicted ATP-grasp superfamily ATP-dependent carboligase
VVHRVLLFGWNDSLVFEVMTSLGVAGHHVTVLSPTPLTGIRLSRYCKRFEPLVDPHWVLQRTDCDVVVPVDERAIEVLARSPDRPPRPAVFPIPTLEQLDVARDKWRFHQRCIELGVPVPATVRIDSPRELADASFDRPRFVKPARGSNSEGARRLDTRADAASYASQAKSWPVLLQDFVPGEDVDVSVLCDRGELVAWTCQRAGGDVHARRVQPEPAALDAARAVVKALGWHGLAHFDMRQSARDGSIVVFELNPRFWLSLMFSTWAGVNFADLGVRLALEEPLPFSPARSGVVRRPLLRPSTLARALVRDGVERQAWSDPLPRALGRFMVRVRSRL